MVIFHSYVSLPEGNVLDFEWIYHDIPWWIGMFPIEIDGLPIKNGVYHDIPW